MTTTLPTADMWADVDARLSSAETEDYAAVQRELEAAEAEHRRLTEQAMMGALGAVGPLDLQRVESRKQLAEMQLRGLPEKHRRARNAASAAHVAAVRALADRVVAEHGDGAAIDAARRKLTDATRELWEAVQAREDAVATLFVEARQAFTRTHRDAPLVEMQAVRDPVTDQLQERPKVIRPAGPDQIRAVYEEQDGMSVAFSGGVNGQAGAVRSLTVDGVPLAPLDGDALLLGAVLEFLPAKVAESARQVTAPLRRWSRS